MHWLDEDKELDKFIAKYDIVPTYTEKLILKLAILHGVIAYNEHEIRKIKGDK